jgi:hypothetical protein
VFCLGDRAEGAVRGLCRGQATSECARLRRPLALLGSDTRRSRLGRRHRRSLRPYPHMRIPGVNWRFSHRASPCRLWILARASRNSGVDAASPHIRSPLVGGCTTIPHARVGSEGWDQSYQRRISASQSRGSPTGSDEAGRASRSLRSCCSGGLQRRPFRYFAMSGEAPKRNKKLAGQRHDRDAPETTAISSDTFLEPLAQRRSGLMSKP